MVLFYFYRRGGASATSYLLSSLEVLCVRIPSTLAPFVFADVVVMPVMHCRWWKLQMERRALDADGVLAAPLVVVRNAVLPVRHYSGDMPALTNNSLPMPRS
jgi:hypothetical protein